MWSNLVFETRNSSRFFVNFNFAGIKLVFLLTPFWESFFFLICLADWILFCFVRQIGFILSYLFLWKGVLVSL